MGERTPRYDSNGHIEGYDEIDGDRITHYNNDVFPVEIAHSEIKGDEIIHYNNEVFSTETGRSKIEGDRITHYNNDVFPVEIAHSEIKDDRIIDYDNNVWPSQTGYSKMAKQNLSRGESSSGSSSMDYSSSGSLSSGSGGTFHFGKIALGVLGFFLMVKCMDYDIRRSVFSMKHGDQNIDKSAINIYINPKTIRKIDKNCDKKLSIEELVAAYPCVKKRVIGAGKRIKFWNDDLVRSNAKSCEELIKDLEDQGY